MEIRFNPTPNGNQPLPTSIEFLAAFCLDLPFVFPEPADDASMLPRFIDEFIGEDGLVILSDYTLKPATAIAVDRDTTVSLDELLTLWSNAG